MRVGTLLLLALASWFGFLYVRTRVRRAREDRLPPGVPAPDPGLRTHSVSHYDACMQALKAFATEYRLTFQHGLCSKKAVTTLSSLRQDALRHLYQMRMRLPNDLDAETALAQHIEGTDGLLRAYIADAQTRCGQALLHMGPIDDTFYKAWYRAHNDEPT